MEPTKKEIIDKCRLSPSTVKLLEDMGEKTYKEVAREVIFLAKPVIVKHERERIKMAVIEQGSVVDHPTKSKRSLLILLGEFFKAINGDGED